MFSRYCFIVGAALIASPLFAAGIGIGSDAITFPDGSTQSTARLPDRIAWVAALGGGDYSDPVEAMNNLDEWCDVPFSNRHCTLLIAPGQYDLGNAQLVMHQYVDIGWYGAGQYRTHRALEQ